MLDVHAAAIEATIRHCPVVVTHSLNRVQLSLSTGYVEGEIRFIDGSRLVFFEFWRHALSGLNRKKYRYHFMDLNNELIFRYVNAPHHRSIATFPDHKHLPSGVIESLPPLFADVFSEAEAYVLGVP